MYTENNSAIINNLGGGVKRKVLSYSENMMSVELHFEKGAIGALHSHPHEQIGYIISGSLLYKEDGQDDKVLKAGDTYYVAPNVEHGVVALEETMLLDVFTPMRKDFI
ncbi:cupin domain-containing protein [Candidatus Galacturonibacter soehngenii]|uniref:Cupin domain-containing protein n=1 Tax=Candidatus Galacturonatibacter soehngenii TaxID=2307010 RepID=A0A7V7QI50_9FIRM|nr:cupin domain-containing protein [Candidatus Galacturonibacter soehngenii]KAB1435835.1 cupin domain-containing protein [Candidatus Galacturonibacter soehngenii]